MRKKDKRNPAAVALSRLAVKAMEAKYTEEERRDIAKKRAERRWKDHEYSQQASAISQRKRRAKLKLEEERGNNETETVK